MADMSFLPEDYLEKRTQRRTNLISLTLFVVVMAGVIGAFFVTDRETVKIQELQNKIDSQYQEAALRLEQLDELQDQKKQMIHKAKVTALLLERVPRSFILAELINTMPTTLSLLELDLETKAIKNKGPRATTAMQRARQKQAAKAGGNTDVNMAVQPTEVSMVMTGVAPTDVQVAQYMTSLGRSEMFLDVNLVFSEEIKINERLMRKFRIEMTLNQQMNIQEIEPKKVRRVLKQNPMAETIHIDADGQLILPQEPSDHADVQNIVDRDTIQSQGD